MCVWGGGSMITSERVERQVDGGSVGSCVGGEGEEVGLMDFPLRLHQQRQRCRKSGVGGVEMWGRGDIS